MVPLKNPNTFLFIASTFLYYLYLKLYIIYFKILNILKYEKSD